MDNHLNPRQFPYHKQFHNHSYFLVKYKASSKRVAELKSSTLFIFSRYQTQNYQGIAYNIGIVFGPLTFNNLIHEIQYFDVTYAKCLQLDVLGVCYMNNPVFNCFYCADQL
jgi:hypothetical protein